MNLYKTLLSLFAVAMIAPACHSQSSTGGNAAPEPAPRAVQEAPKSRVDTITVHSAAMNKDIKSIVILPASYQADNSARFASVYLLHGFDGTYKDWLAHKPDLTAQADELGLIIICPDGQDSWYFDSPVDKKMRFETYIGSELVNAIDSLYRTRDDRRFRAITGLSMGGHGAFWVGVRHPDTFSGIGSMSGGLDITLHPRSWKIPDRLGPFAANQARWKDHSAIGLVPKIGKGQFDIIIDCGISDIMIKDNEAMHKALVAAGIDHDYISRLGNHSWKYWCKAVELQLDFFHNAFKRAEEANDKTPQAK